METKNKSSKFIDAIFYILIIGCVIAILATQYIVASTAANKTEDVGLFTTKHTIAFTGIIVRNETILYSDIPQGNVLSYSVQNGDRINKNTEIARIYNSSEQIYYRYKISQLEQELITLQESQNRGTTEYVQPEFISDRVSERYKSQLMSIKNGDLDSVYENRLDLLKLMCIYNISVNAEENYTERINSIANDIEVLKSKLLDPISVISASGSGYFTSLVDGYETQLNSENADKITAETINQIISNLKSGSKPLDNVIGKTFDDYKWKMIGIIDTADRFFVNTDQKLYFYSLDKLYSVHVDSITPTGNGNEAVVVISCDEMDGNIASVRMDNVELLFGEYTGIRVPRSAIRFIDGKRVVYIMEGENIIHKELDVIYEGDEYVLSAVTDNEAFVNLYDRVILEPIVVSENLT